MHKAVLNCPRANLHLYINEFLTRYKQNLVRHRPNDSQRYLPHYHNILFERAKNATGQDKLIVSILSDDCRRGDVSIH